MSIRRATHQATDRRGALRLAGLAQVLDVREHYRAALSTL
jgi:hypothetical protein